jgi:hypothetical protein
MGNNFSSDARRQAATTMSSQSDKYTRTSKGTKNPSEVWKVSRARVARAIVADPDVLFYWAFLGSNKARARCLLVVSALEKMILASEGITLSHTSELAVSASVQAATGLHQIAEKRGDISEATRIVLSEVEAEAKAMLPGIKQGTRLQEKGAEAQRKYSEARDELVALWEGLYLLLYPIQPSQGFLTHVRFLRAEAVRIPAKNLQTLTENTPSSDSMSSYVLQMLAGAASVAAMGREVDPFYRVHLDDGIAAFPADVAVHSPKIVGGFVTEFSTTPSLTQLGVQVGDRVSWGGATATVAAVGATAVLTSSSLRAPIPRALSVRSQPSLDYITMSAALLSGLESLPSEISTLLETLTKLESNPKKAAEYLGQLLAVFSTLTSDVSASLLRRDIEPPTTAFPLCATLLAFSPAFRAETRATGKAAIMELRKQGFDRAAELLVGSKIDEFLEIEDSAASHSAMVAKALPGFVSLTGGDILPTTGAVRRG